MDQQTYRFEWQGIEIEAIYTPRKWNVIAHLEIRSVRPERAPLPITDTGYHSSFHEPSDIEANDIGIVEQIIACLDEEAKTKGWRSYVEASRQGSLF